MSAYIFYGKAGSGKGTQAKLLKEKLESLGRKVIYIETGELFRQFVANHDSFASKRTKDVIDNGGLMPAFFPIYLWADQLIENFDGMQDIIFDGVARRIEEAPMIDSAINFFSIEKTFVFNIHINDATAIMRLSIRGDRPDDASVDKIQNRLNWYGTNVMPVIDYFKNHPHFAFTEIDGEKTVPEVFVQIEKSIE